jgi:hypothetical protein
MSTQAAYGKRSGWVTFAATVMLAVGGLRFISAISYFADSNRVNDLSGGLFGDQLWAWGLVDLILAGLALVAGLSLLKGGTFGRLFGFAWGMIVIVQSLLIIGVAPWYAAATLALAGLVLYGLAVTTEEE